MSSFQVVAFADSRKTTIDELLWDSKDEPKLPALVRWLRAECSHSSLRNVARLLYRNHQHEDHFDRQALENELRERTSAYYALLWSTLSPSERLILFQLANDGWANPKNEVAIRQLLLKKLIRAEPMFKVMNESFRTFIREVQDQRQIAAWEKQGRQSSWRSLKASLLAAAIGLGAWLFYAQKDLFQGVIGYILSLGAAVAAISNIVGGYKSRVGSSTKGADASESGSTG